MIIASVVWINSGASVVPDVSICSVECVAEEVERVLIASNISAVKPQEASESTRASVTKILSLFFNTITVIKIIGLSCN